MECSGVNNVNTIPHDVEALLSHRREWLFYNDILLSLYQPAT